MRAAALGLALVAAALPPRAEPIRESLDCPLRIDGHLPPLLALVAGVSFPLRGRIAVSTRVEGDEMRTTSVVDLAGSLGLEEHMRISGGRLQEYDAYSKPSRDFGNRENKWVRMRVDWSRNPPRAAVGLIRSKKGADLPGPQRAFYDAHRDALADPLRAEPMSAEWLREFDGAAPTDRTHDMAPDPFAEDLHEPAHFLFYELQHLPPDRDRITVRFFNIGKRQHVFEVPMSRGPRSGGKAEWSARYIVQDHADPMGITIDYSDPARPTVASFWMKLHFDTPVGGIDMAVASDGCASR